MNNVLFKIFGAMSKDSYRYIWKCFGIDPVEQLMQKQQDKFSKKNIANLKIC